METQLRRYCRMKKASSKSRGIDWQLTDDQVQQKLDEAGITLDDVGRSGYHLCRVNDEGPYDVTCSFKTGAENNREKKYKKVPVIIEGTIYESKAEAARALGMFPQTLVKRLLSTNPLYAQWRIL